MQDEGQDEGIRWDLYPHVAAIPQARAFILRLRQLSRRPKTVDAYARNLDRFVASFAGVAAERWVEADEGVLLTYLDDLRHGRPRQRGRSRGGRERLALPVRDRGGLRDRRRGARREPHVDELVGLGVARVLSHPTSFAVALGATSRKSPSLGILSLALAPAPTHRTTQASSSCISTPPPRALLLVAYDGALRREELVGLRADDYDYDRHQAVLRVRAETSKSGRERWVPLSPFGQRALDHYLDRHRRALVGTYALDECGSLFLSESTRNPGRPLAPGAVNDVVEALRAALGLPQLRPHTFRHQRLSTLKAAGVPLEDIALFAGHVSTETTRLYLHLTPAELGAKIRAATRGTDAHLAQLIEEALNGR